MKRLVVIALLVAILAPAVFADDALVLPQGISRLTFVPILGFVNGAWDEDGDHTDNEDDARDGLPDEVVFAFGGAYEYGLTNQVSLGLQWAPAYQFASDADATGSDDYDAQAQGFEHIDLGAEIQILGEQGYIPHQMFRFSVTPGIGIPLPGYGDWESAGEDFAAQKDAPIPDSVNRSEFQAGVLVNFDYIITEIFEVNLFTEGRYRFPRTYDVADFYNAFVAGVAAGTPGFNGEDVYDSYDLVYGGHTYWEFGMEPKAKIPLSETFRLDLSVTGLFALQTAQEVEQDLELTTIGGVVVPVVGADPAAQAVGVVAASETDDGDTSYVFSIAPEIGTFIRALPLPIELSAAYSIALFGQDETQANRLVFILRAFF